MAAFLDHRIGFPDIPAIVEDTLGAHRLGEPEDLAAVARADAWGRARASELALRRSFSARA